MPLFRKLVLQVLAIHDQINCDFLKLIYNLVNHNLPT